MDRYSLDDQIRDAAINKDVAKAARDMKAEVKDLEEALGGLLFWIAQGDFSRMPVPAIEDMHRAIDRAKKLTT